MTRVNIAGLDRAEMKVGFDAGSDEMRVDLYDRDNGAGAAARVIDGLRRKAA